MDGVHSDAGMASAGVGVGEGLTTRNTEKKIKDLTLVFCRRKTKATSNTTTDATADVKNEVKNGNEILLGLKKRGFGEGKWNGEPSRLADGFIKLLAEHVCRSA